jgi:hypothetical protein
MSWFWDLTKTNISTNNKSTCILQIAPNYFLAISLSDRDGMFFWFQNYTLARKVLFSIKKCLRVLQDINQKCEFIQPFEVFINNKRTQNVVKYVAEVVSFTIPKNKCLGSSFFKWLKFQKSYYCRLWKYHPLT